MPLPRKAPPITTPGYAGLIQWLREEMPALIQHIKDKAPHLLVQAVHGLADPGYGGGPSMLYPTWRGPGLNALGYSGYDRGPMMGLGQDAGTDVTSTFISPSVDTSGYTPPDITPTPDVTQPGAAAGGWADTIARLATPVITGFEQIKLFNTQLSLAQQGKPPLNVSALRLPTVPVRVGVSFAGLPTWAPWALGAGLLFVLFGRRRA